MDIATDTTNRLNEDVIRALPVPPNGNRVHYFGGARLQGFEAPRGFGVRVTAAGAKAFVLGYRHQGKERRYTIGRFPDWSALKAVREAKELRRRIDKGEDPLQDRAPVPAGTTVADVLDTFVERVARAADRPLAFVLSLSGQPDGALDPAQG